MMKWADAQKLMYSQSSGWIVSFGVYNWILQITVRLAVLELQNRGFSQCARLAKTMV